MSFSLPQLFAKVVVGAGSISASAGLLDFIQQSLFHYLIRRPFAAGIEFDLSAGLMNQHSGSVDGLATQRLCLTDQLRGSRDENNIHNHKVGRLFAFGGINLRRAKSR